MALPKRRTSRSRSRMRRAHQAVKRAQVVYCPNCGSATLPHRMCENCGQYQGRQVVEMEEG